MSRNGAFMAAVAVLACAEGEVLDGDGSPGAAGHAAGAGASGGLAGMGGIANSAGSPAASGGAMLDTGGTHAGGSGTGAEGGGGSAGGDGQAGGTGCIDGSAPTADGTACVEGSSGAGGSADAGGSGGTVGTGGTAGADGGNCLTCHCANGVQDADETFVDCGGANCAGCTPPDASCTSASNGGGYYWFCTNLRDWPTARNNCMNIGFDLVTIGDPTENAYVDGNLAGIGWIGFNDRPEYTTENTFVWQSGAATSYTNWNSGQPNDNNTGEDCAEIYDGGLWWDNACTVTHIYACEY